MRRAEEERWREPRGPHGELGQQLHGPRSELGQQLNGPRCELGQPQRGQLLAALLAAGLQALHPGKEEQEKGGTGRAGGQEGTGREGRGR